MGVLTFFILATYAAQIIQIYFFSVPSAGSTVEMLFKVKKDPARADYHPAAAAIQSRTKMTVLILATLASGVHINNHMRYKILGVKSTFDF